MHEASRYVYKSTKLNDAQIEMIRRDTKSTLRSLARVYGVSYGTIFNLRKHGFNNSNRIRDKK